MEKFIKKVFKPKEYSDDLLKEGEEILKNNEVVRITHEHFLQDSNPEKASEFLKFVAKNKKFFGMVPKFGLQLWEREEQSDFDYKWNENSKKFVRISKGSGK